MILEDANSKPKKIYHIIINKIYNAWMYCMEELDYWVNSLCKLSKLNVNLTSYTRGPYAIVDIDDATLLINTTP